MSRTTSSHRATGRGVAALTLSILLVTGTAACGSSSDDALPPETTAGQTTTPGDTTASGDTTPVTSSASEAEVTKFCDTARDMEPMGDGLTKTRDLLKVALPENKGALQALAAYLESQQEGSKNASKKAALEEGGIKGYLDVIKSLADNCGIKLNPMG